LHEVTVLAERCAQTHPELSTVNEALRSLGLIL